MKRKSPVAFASLVLLSLAVPLSASAQSMPASPVREEIAQQAIASADLSKNRTVAASEGEKQYDVGVSLYDSGKFSEAIAAFKEATKFRPNDAQAYFMLGMSEAKLQLYKDAVESFRRATRLKPDWPEAQFRLGIVSHVWGRSALATEAYTTLVKLNSSLANTLFRVIQGEKNSASVAAQIGDEFWVLDPAKSPANKEPISTNQVASAENVSPPATETAVPDATLANVYRIGVGDILDIRLLKFATKRSTLYTVLEGGLIDYPMIGGPLLVAGLTTDEVQKNLAVELKRRAVEESPGVTVGVRHYASHTVSISGLVTSPGTKYLRREAVPLYVIMAESQTRQDAGRVAIMRAGKEVVLDLADASSMNFLIKAGDLISVTAHPRRFYYIGGKINYPGQKVFESGMTLLQAILAAGGTARQGDNVVEVSRETGAGRLNTTKFRLKEIKTGKIPDPKLQPGDRIEVVK